MEIKYRELHINEDEKLTNFLIKINKVFNTPLTERVDIDEYVNKILSEGMVIIAEVESEIVGSIMGYANNYDSKIAYASIFGVLENYRRQGIGKRLIDLMKNESYSRGMRKLSLYKNKENEKAIKFYKSNGFKNVITSGLRKDKDVFLVCDLENNINKVLITAIGSFSADNVINTLKGLGYYVIGCDIYPRKWLVNGLYVDEFKQVPLATNEDEYIASIKDILNNNKIEFILPLTDIEVDIFSKYEDVFNNYDTIVCISNKEAISISRDKFKFQNFLSDINIEHYIPTQIVGSEKKLEFPVFVKPIQGRSSQGTLLIENENEYDSFLQTKKGEYIVQPFIKGQIITVDVIRNPLTEEVFCLARKELLRNEAGAGTTIEIINDKDIIKLSEEIVKKVNIVGVVNIEFIQTEDGKNFILELNPRFSGGVKFSQIAGYDFVENHIAVFKQENIDTEAHIKRLIISKSYTEHVLDKNHN